MEAEASDADQQISHEADEENRIMAMFSAVVYADVCKVEEEEIRESVYNLGSIWRCVVILWNVSLQL